MTRPSDDLPGAPQGDRRRVTEVFERKGEMKTKRRRLSALDEELRAAKDPEKVAELLGAYRSERLELVELKKGLRAAREGRDRGEARTGALPNFAIIGAQKCGTTSLYRLLTQHPHVEPAVFKELHFFDKRFDQGIEWYRGCFPAPERKQESVAITGEATPSYLFYPEVPERMRRVVPEARLIVLLRDPVDRTYSHYQQQLRKGNESLPFEEAIEAEEARLRGDGDGAPADNGRDVGFKYQHFSYLSRGLYAE